MRLSATDVGHGPAALLLHGQPGSAGDWTPVAARLPGLRVIAPDRPGYGETGGRAVGFEENAAAAIELLDRLGVESAVVAAHSWATGVALVAAIRSPDRVSGLVLAAPIAPGRPAGAFDRLLAEPLVGRAATGVGLGFAGAALALRPVRALVCRALPGLRPDDLARTAAEWRGGAWRSFYVEQRALLDELPSLAPELGEVRGEVTLLQGRRDRLSSPGQARWLAAALPRAELLMVDGAGHLLPQQRPDLVADAIRRAAERAPAGHPG